MSRDSERRRKRADWLMWNAVDRPREQELRKAAEDMDAIRAVDPVAADAKEQAQLWHERAEADGGRHAENLAAWYRERWVTLAGTNPKLAHLVGVEDRQTFRDVLEGEYGRARTAWLEALDGVEELRGRLAAGEDVAEELTAAESTLAVVRARYHAEERARGGMVFGDPPPDKPRRNLRGPR